MRRTGTKKLKAWRKREGVSQGVFAGEICVVQSAVAEWERNPRRRPELPSAALIEKRTKGEVKVEDWGYPDNIVDLFVELARLRAESAAAAPLAGAA